MASASLIIIILSLILFFVIILNKESYINFNVDTSYLLLDKNLINNNNKYQIPKLLSQTYHTKEKIPQHIKDLLSKYTEDYQYILLNDSEGLSFLKKYFNVLVIEKYNSLKGPHKADLLRYCWLYINGGIYLDIKTLLIKPLSEIINHSKITNVDQIYTVKSYVTDDSIYQGFIATSPRNIIFLFLIDKIIKTNSIFYLIDYLIFTKQMYNAIEYFKDKQDITLFTEKCENKNENNKDLIDRYNHYCYLLDSNNNKLLNIRDPTYPW